MGTATLGDLCTAHVMFETVRVTDCVWVSSATTSTFSVPSWRCRLQRIFSMEFSGTPDGDRRPCRYFFKIEYGSIASGGGAEGYSSWCRMYGKRGQLGNMPPPVHGARLQKSEDPDDGLA